MVIYVLSIMSGLLLLGLLFWGTSAKAQSRAEDDFFTWHELDSQPVRLSLFSRLQLWIMPDSSFDHWGRGVKAYLQSGDTQPIEKARRQLEQRLVSPSRYHPRIEKIQINSPKGCSIALRIYRPKRLKADAPLVYYVQGGGFIVGSPAVGEAFCRRIAVQMEAEVVSVDYALAPEYPFPAATDDVMCVYDHLLKHHLTQSRKFILCGDSAGGNLAAVATGLSLQDGKRKPDGLFLVYPVTDFTASDMTTLEAFRRGFGLTDSALEACRDGYVPKGVDLKDWRLSVIYADVQNFPPTVVVTCQYDVLRQDGLRFAQRLSAAQIPVRYECMSGTVHGFLSSEWSPAFRRTTALMGRFLKLLTNQDSPSLSERASSR